MNLPDFRRAVEIARLANVPVTLTLEQAQWLLEGVEKGIEALKMVELTFDFDENYGCPWCNQWRRPWEAEEPEHKTDCPRQLALKHWEREP